MCLTSPLCIKKIRGEKAELEDGRLVSIGLLAGLKVGDYVLANANLALNKITAEEADEIKEYFK